MTTTASLFDGKLFKSGLFNGGIFESEGITLASLIASLFGDGEQGGLWLPGPDTCYTDNGTTLCTAPGALVYRMDDLSGNGNHAIQATEAARPALQQTAGGLWYLAFDGVDDFLRTGSVSISEFHSMATAVNTTTPIASGRNADPVGFIAAAGSYNMASITIYRGGTVIKFRTRYIGLDDFSSTDAQIVLDANSNLPSTVLLQERITTTSLKKYINGGIAIERTAASTAPVDPAIWQFGPHERTAQFQPINIFANFVRAGTLTDSNREQLHELLAARSGATLV